MPSDLELFHVMLALLTFLIASHLGGFVFARLGLPPVIGEIAGGICIGPSVLGALAPGLSAVLFDEQGRVSLVLGMTYNFGSMLLLYCSGLGLGGLSGGADRRLAVALAAFGSVLPLAGGLAFGYIFDMNRFLGPAADELALALVTAVAISVTSLPVLTRIFMDLGILGSRFAKICLTASILDDVVLYVILAIALSLVSAADTSPFGLLPMLLADSSLWVRLVFVSAANLGFVLVCAFWSKGLLGWLESTGLRWLSLRSPVAWHLSILVAMVALSLILGIPLVLGAFCAGLMVARSPQGSGIGREAIERFSGGFFVPIYFALVGFRLDIGRDLDPAFFAGLLIYASLVKSGSTYLGARVGGAEPGLARGLAIVLNARGGPGIIVASMAFDAGIISQSFYTALVLLAVVTSLAAGAWLTHRQRSGRDVSLLAPQVAKT